MLGPVISQIWPDVLRRSRRQIAGIRDERLAVALQRLFDHGMPAALDGKAERADRPRAARNCRRPRVLPARLRHRAPQRHARRRADRRWLQRHRAEPLEDFQLEPERAVAGIGDLGFDLAEFGCGEAHLSGQRLAMDEGRIQRRRHQPVAMLRRDLDEIAQHIVVPDLQALDAGIVGVARLHRGDDEARGVAQAAGLVERRLIAARAQSRRRA